MFDAIDDISLFNLYLVLLVIINQYGPHFTQLFDLIK